MQLLRPETYRLVAGVELVINFALLAREELIQISQRVGLGEGLGQLSRGIFIAHFVTISLICVCRPIFNFIASMMQIFY